MGSEVNEAMIIAFIFYAVGYAAGMLVWFIGKWVNYGIYEHNLLRCAIHSLLAPVWPIALAVYAVRAVRKYADTRFAEDYADLFGKPPAPAPGFPRSIPIEQLAGTKSSYKPGDWIN